MQQPGGLQNQKIPKTALISLSSSDRRSVSIHPVDVLLVSLLHICHHKSWVIVIWHKHSTNMSRQILSDSNIRMQFDLQRPPLEFHGSSDKATFWTPLLTGETHSSRNLNFIVQIILRLISFHRFTSWSNSSIQTDPRKKTYKMISNEQKIVGKSDWSWNGHLKLFKPHKFTMADHFSQHCTSNIPGQANNKKISTKKFVQTKLYKSIVTYPHRPAQMWGQVCQGERTSPPRFPALGRWSPPRKTWASGSWWVLTFSDAGAVKSKKNGNRIFWLQWWWWWQGWWHWWSLCWVSIDTDVGNHWTPFQHWLHFAQGDIPAIGNHREDFDGNLDFDHFHYDVDDLVQ